MNAKNPAARRQRGIILVAVVAAQLADLVTLRLATFVVSMDGELNPLIRAQYADGGFDAVVVAKLGWLAVMLVAVALLARTSFPLVRAIVPLVPVTLGWFGALVNLTTFVAVSV